MSVFSDTYGTYVLYLVPAYGLYIVLGYLFSYLKSRSDSATTADPEDDPSLAKQKAKKERQRQRAEKLSGGTG